MVKIKKGTSQLTVTKGAYKEVYAPNGWHLATDLPPLTSQESYMAPEAFGDSKHSPEGEESNTEDSVASEDDTLEGMTDMELRQYASLLGIKVNSLKTREDLVEAIQSHQE